MSLLIHKVMTGLHISSRLAPKSRIRSITFSVLPFRDSVGFFDGAEQNGSYGAGMVIQMTVKHSFSICMNLGRGTNTRDELLALWGLLHFDLVRGIDVLMILGDSKAIIDWALNKQQIQSICITTRLGGLAL